MRTRGVPHDRLAVLLLAVLPWAVAQEGARWREAPPLPTPRAEMAAVVAHGTIYVPGGLDAGGTALDVFEAFDPTAGQWRALPPLPRGVHHAGVAALGGSIYVVGGYDGRDFEVDVSQAWAYRIDEGRWEELAEMPAPRAAHALVAVEGRLLAIGGVGPDSQEVWEYDPAADSWRSTGAPLPTQREHLAAAVLDGRVYVVGGRWRGTGNLATLEIYDPHADRWERGPNMPTPRGGLTAVAHNGRLYVTGGEAFEPARTFGEAEVFDPAAEEWRRLPALPSPRHGAASAVASGRWHVIGGGTEAGLAVSDIVEVLPLGD